MKKVVIVHGWGGNSRESWFPWLKKKLEEKNIEIKIPDMPNTNYPKINEWIEKIKEVVKTPDENVYFIGHSIGCQVIMRYLEILPEGVKVGKVIFVAGWFDLTDEAYEDKEDKEIIKPWIKTPIDFDKVKSHSDSFVAINSDDDPYVDISQLKIFEKELNAKTIILNKKGHICGEHGVTELPEILEFLE